MEWGAYIPVVVIAMAILVSAIYALYWAVKNRQFQQLDRSAAVIFDDEEPVGQVTDSFPGQRRPAATDTTSPEPISQKPTR